MSLIQHFTCASEGCGFEASFGWSHDLSASVRMALCMHCLNRVFLEEAHDPWGDGYNMDPWVMLIMELAPPPDLGKTPRERRLKRKALGLPPEGRGGGPRPTFHATGGQVAFDRQGNPIEGMQDVCPHCAKKGGIILGFDEDSRCPKCAAALRFELWE